MVVLSTHRLLGKRVENRTPWELLGCNFQALLVLDSKERRSGSRIIITLIPNICKHLGSYYENLIITTRLQDFQLGAWP